MRLIGLAVVLALSLFAAPLAADSQQTGRIPRIGYLSASSPSASEYVRKAFTEGLRDLGWTEGQNILVEECWSEGNYDRLASQAAELVRLNVDVIVAAGPNPVIRASKQATSAVPIVMTVAGDPVGQGFIASLRRPGGNIAGVAWDADPMITEKYFELLKEVIPGLRRVGAILDPGDPPATVYRKAARQAVYKLGLTLHEAEVSAPHEIEKAFASITTGGGQAVFVYGSPLFFLHRGQFVALAAKYKLPGIHITREFVEAGALMCYGVRIRDLFRRAATYVDKILRGAKPADLPVEQPTKFELVINLKTAKTLGLTIPQSVQVRADEIIQ